MGKCLECGKETNNPKFCSHSCSATYNNKKKTKTKYCENCGKKLIGRQRWGNKFCSTFCFRSYQFDKKISKYILSF